MQVPNKSLYKNIFVLPRSGVI